jgi:hypothetical protein
VSVEAISYFLEAEDYMSEKKMNISNGNKASSYKNNF